MGSKYVATNTSYDRLPACATGSHYAFWGNSCQYSESIILFIPFIISKLSYNKKKTNDQYVNLSLYLKFKKRYLHHVSTLYKSSSGKTYIKLDMYKTSFFRSANSCASKHNKPPQCVKTEIYLIFT